MSKRPTFKAMCAFLAFSLVSIRIQFAVQLSSQQPSFPKFVIDTKRAQHFFDSNRGQYGNKSDFPSAMRLFGFMKTLGLDTKESVVMVGGTNDAQLASALLKQCPSMTLYGFEIQPYHFVNAQENLKNFPHATVVNLGWDEREAASVPIGGSGETAGLFDPKGQRGWKLQEGAGAKTVTLEKWTTDNQVKQVLYVVIDTEGHEPKVIRGMKLDLVENQKKFPLFQYELGGTWAAEDQRHGNDQWTLRDTARHLEDFGYILLLTGDINWLAVNGEFFDETAGNPALSNEGHGPFVQGNILAMHREFTPGPLAARILENVRVIS